MLGVGEDGAEEVSRTCVERDKVAARQAVVVISNRRTSIRPLPRRQHHAKLLGEELEGFAEVHLVELLDETENVAAAATDEAVEDSLGRHHAHRGLVVVVERAQADILAALWLEGDDLAHHAHDVRRVPDAVLVTVLDPHTGHVLRPPRTTPGTERSVPKPPVFPSTLLLFQT
jgi:hypothetical protein